MEKELTKKEEAGAGIILSVIIFTLVVLAIFLWSPIGHYLGKWNDYWDNKGSVQTNQSSLPEYYYRYLRAEKDCEDRATKLWGKHTSVSAFNTSSSTSESKYSTYDCYGVKYTKIP